MSGSDLHAPWWDSGPVEVASGIYRIPLPLPHDRLRAVNVYAIESEEGFALIDGGWALDESMLVLGAALEGLGLRLELVTDVLVTHVHRDHYTQALTLRRLYGADVSLGVGEQRSLDALMAPNRAPLTAQFAELRTCGAEPLIGALIREGHGTLSDADYWAPPDVWLHAGASITVGSRRLEVVPTPGHTQGHVVFVDLDAGLIFSGDHVLPHITPSIGFENAIADLPLLDYLNSLRRVREFPDLQMLPAHGPDAPSVHHRIDELIRHHEVRLGACEAETGGDPVTAAEVAARLPWTRHAVPLTSLDAFNQMLAVLEAKAHLDMLVTLGRVARSRMEETWEYVASKSAGGRSE